MIRLIVVLALLAVSGDAASSRIGNRGLDDPGFSRGVLRTEYEDVNTGTDIQPLSIYCTVSDAAGFDCDSVRRVFDSSFAFSNQIEWPTQHYWMITNNNDAGPLQRCDSGGPPDQSNELRAPGEGLTSVSSHVVQNGQKMLRIEVNQRSFANPCGLDSAPFVGAGAFWGRGNSTPIGYLNGAGTITSFSAQLLKYASFGWTRYARVWVYAGADCGDGTTCLAFVSLYSVAEDDNGRTHPRDTGTGSVWFWPYKDSVYFPGAEFHMVDGRELGLRHLEEEPTTYAVDWQRVFRIIPWAKSLPTNRPLPIKYVAFAVELVDAVDLQVGIWDVFQNSPVKPLPLPLSPRVQ